MKFICKVMLVCLGGLLYWQYGARANYWSFITGVSYSGCDAACQRVIGGYTSSGSCPDGLIMGSSSGSSSGSGSSSSSGSGTPCYYPWRDARALGSLGSMISTFVSTEDPDASNPSKLYWSDVLVVGPDHTTGIINECFCVTTEYASALQQALNARTACANGLTSCVGSGCMASKTGGYWKIYIGGGTQSKVAPSALASQAGLYMPSATWASVTANCKTNCKANYYPTTSSNGSWVCEICELDSTKAPEYSAARATDITGCYVPANVNQSDDGGTYVFTSNCYYSS